MTAMAKLSDAIGGSEWKLCCVSISPPPFITNDNVPLTSGVL